MNHGASARESRWLVSSHGELTMDRQASALSRGTSSGARRGVPNTRFDLPARRRLSPCPRASQWSPAKVHWRRRAVPGCMEAATSRSNSRPSADEEGTERHDEQVQQAIASSSLRVGRSCSRSARGTVSVERSAERRPGGDAPLVAAGTSTPCACGARTAAKSWRLPVEQDTSSHRGRWSWTR